MSWLSTLFENFLTFIYIKIPYPKTAMYFLYQRYASTWWLIEISVPVTTVSTGDFTLLRDEDLLLGDHEVTRKYYFWNTS